MLGPLELVIEAIVSHPTWKLKSSLLEEQYPCLTLELSLHLSRPWIFFPVYFIYFYFYGDRVTFIPGWLPICYIAKNGLSLLILLPFPLNSGIADVYHYNQFYAVLGPNPGLYAC